VSFEISILRRELWAKWETLLGVFQGGSIAVFSIALL